MTITGGSFAASRHSTPLVTLDDADMYCLLALRLAEDQQLGSIAPLVKSVLCTTHAFGWCLRLDPTVTGTALSFSSLTSSGIEVDEARTNATKITNGTVLACGYHPSTANGRLEEIVPANLCMLATTGRPILVLAVHRIGSGAATFYGSLGWREKV